MRSLLAFVAVGLMLPGPVFAPLGLPGAYLTDRRTAIVCAWETRGEPKPSWAVDRKVGAAWGACQVKYWSAIHFGGFDEQMRLTGVPSRSPGDLFQSPVNRKVADRIIQVCEERLGYNDTDISVFHCFGTGKLDSTPPTTRRVWGYDPYIDRNGWIVVASYAKQQASDMAAVRLKTKARGGHDGFYTKLARRESAGVVFSIPVGRIISYLRGDGNIHTYPASTFSEGPESPY